MIGETRKSILYASNQDKARFIKDILDKSRYKMTDTKVAKLEKLIENLTNQL